HEVTVYATGDSRPAARLRSHFEQPKWPPDERAEVRHVAYAFGDIAAQGFDVVHVNQVQALPYAAQSGLPAVLTLHHPRDDKMLAAYADFPSVTYVGISARQVETMPELSGAQVVHHGLDPSLYPAGPGDGGYCAFLGRL